MSKHTFTIDPAELFLMCGSSDVIDAKLDLDELGMFVLSKENARKAIKCAEKATKYSQHREYFDSLNKPLADLSEEELEKLLWYISRENSTRTSNTDVAVIAKYIHKNFADFSVRVKSGDISLVEELAKIDGLSRRELSYASKICALISEIETRERKFPITDSVIRSVLPYYRWYFKLPLTLTEAYRDTVNAVDELCKLSKLNYTEIDRILWYCYKDDSSRLCWAKICVNVNIRIRESEK